MKVSKGVHYECRWRPPTDMGPQVWMTNTLSKLLLFHVLKKDGTVNQKLLNMVTKTVPAKKKPKNGVFSVDFSIDSHTGVWCRIFVPAWVDPGTKLPIMLYMHGGGFVLGRPNAKEYDLHCRHLSKMCESVVISISYRRSPEYKHPAAYEDGLIALEWLKSQRSSPHPDFPSQADFSKVFLAGDSAGANVAHHVAVKVGSIDISPISIAGLILIQPFFGGEERTASEIRYKNGRMCGMAEIDWYWRAFLPAGSDRDHPASNVCGPKSPTFATMELPKILVVVGGRDPMQDRQMQYAEAMQMAGKDCKVVVYEKAFHGFYCFGSVRATLALHLDVEEFIHPPGDDKSVGGGMEELALELAMEKPRRSISNLLERMMSW